MYSCKFSQKLIFKRIQTHTENGYFQQKYEGGGIFLDQNLKKRSISLSNTSRISKIYASLFRKIDIIPVFLHKKIDKINKITLILSIFCAKTRE